MSFLQGITGFNKGSLAPTVTRVTTASGKVSEESRDQSGREQVQGSVDVSAGFVVSNDARPDADEGGPSAGEVEFEVESTLQTMGRSNNIDAEELRQLAAWAVKRTNLGDGFSCSPEAPEVQCGVFVTCKSKNERHYDRLAFLLSDWCSLRQVDRDDLVGGRVLPCLDCMLFPGGSIFEVDPALGDGGAKAIAEWVQAGGGYVGICAGAFIAAADGYNGADHGRALLGTQGSWRPGVGSAEVRLTAAAADVLGPEFSEGKMLSMYFANGLVAGPAVAHNGHLDQEIPPAQVLATYVSVQTNKCSEEKMEETAGTRNGAVLASALGKGRCVVFGPHPEASGKPWMLALANAIRWAKGGGTNARQQVEK